MLMTYQQLRDEAVAANGPKNLATDDLIAAKESLERRRQQRPGDL
jgi:hypothetical protein